MAVFVIGCLGVFVAGLIVYMISAGSGPDTLASEPPPTEAELLQARLDLLKVDLGVSAALAKLEHQQAVERVKDEIAEVFEDGRR